MKVLIALASSSGQLSGIQRHAINLARCLLKRREIAEVHLVAAPWQRSFVRDAATWSDQRLHLHTAPIGNSTVSRNLWFHFKLPKLAAQLNADIVHLAYPVPVRRAAFHCPTVVTLHDLYPYDIPENFGFPKVFLNRVVLRQCLSRVDAIACVSHCTLSRLQTLHPRLARKAAVIPNSVERQTHPDTPLAKCVGQPFLLCVAQHRRNKNISLAIEVFARLSREGHIPAGTRLLIVGIAGPESAAIKRAIAGIELPQNVILLNGISDAQLDWCYRNCSVILAPSIVEGFGLPVAEALLAGCRVVCSDIPAFREISRELCDFVSLGPRQIDAFAEAVRAALRQPIPAPVRLPQLSPQVIAESYLRLYRSLMPAAEANADSIHTEFAATGEKQQLL
jgi:glycosyltransferase involved in cell wall biosynthesis